MHDAHREPDARTGAGHPPRCKVLAMLSAAALLMHGMLLGGLGGAQFEPAVPLQRGATLQVRTVADSDANATATAATALTSARIAAALEPSDDPAARRVTRGNGVRDIAESAAGSTLSSKAQAAQRVPMPPRGQSLRRARPVDLAQSHEARFDADASRPRHVPAPASKLQTTGPATADARALSAAASDTERSTLPRSPEGDPDSLDPKPYAPMAKSTPAMPSTTPGASIASAPAVDSVTGAAGAPEILAAVSAPAVTAAAEPAPIPRYRTEVPPAATLHYQIGRGLLRGSAELTWQPEGDRYEFRLEAFLAGITILKQVSQGGFDAAGLAPLRFTDKRVRRAEEAANFRRDRDQITFSARSTQMALRAGTQDRLSWMIQLAAIAAADPALRREGAQVVMQVVGVHADASVWVLRCGGVESLRTDLGTVEALTFARVPDGPYDTAAQIWLDPKRHYLPVRATWRSGPNDEGMDMRLREVVK